MSIHYEKKIMSPFTFNRLVNLVLFEEVNAAKKIER